MQYVLQELILNADNQEVQRPFKASFPKDIEAETLLAAECKSFLSPRKVDDPATKYHRWS